MRVRHSRDRRRHKAKGARGRMAGVRWIAEQGVGESGLGRGKHASRVKHCGSWSFPDVDLIIDVV